MGAEHDFSGRDGGNDVVNIRHTPISSTTGCHACTIAQDATSGRGTALNVTSANPDTPAAVIKGAGDLIVLRDATGTTQFAVSQAGAVTAAGVALPTESTAVLTTGDQTVGGVKTFTSIPVAPASDPTTGNQAARKAYVDWLVGDQPADQNLLAWTYDPCQAGHVTAQSNAGVAGRVTLTRIILRRAITWANIWIGLSGVDAGASLSNCYVGVYDTGGNLVGTTADISTSLASGATPKALPLASSFPAAAGTYFIAMLLNGTWATNSFTFKASGAGVSTNAGLSAPNLRYSNLLTSQTSLPLSITLANQATTIITTGWGSQWYGVS